MICFWMKKAWTTLVPCRVELPWDRPVALRQAHRPNVQAVDELWRPPSLSGDDFGGATAHVEYDGSGDLGHEREGAAEAEPRFIRSRNHVVL